MILPINKNQQMTMKLDKLLRDATGMTSKSPAERRYRVLQAMLYSEGFTITLGGIKKWFERGSVPSAWLGRIVKAAALHGRPINLANYI